MKTMRQVLGLLCLLVLASGAGAASTSWINASGGAYNNSINWSAGVPGESDTAVFGLAATYDVSFGGDYTADKMQVNSGVVGFALGGYIYTLGYGGNENDPTAIINGQLNVANGQVQSGAVVIGYGEGDSGVLNLDLGGGNLWQTLLTRNWYPLVIGREGHGTMNITSGTMNHGHGWAAMSPVSQADITIDGDGASWEVDGWFGMGDGGTANVTVSNQGYMRIGKCDMAMQSCGKAHVVMQSQSNWELYSQPDEVALMIGYNGSATVDMSEESDLLCSDHLNVAGFPGSYGRLTVSGSDTNVNVFGEVVVGGHSAIAEPETPAGPGGQALVEINNLGQISVYDHVTIYPNGTIAMNNGLLSGTTVDVQGKLNGSGMIFAGVNNEGSVTAGAPTDILMCTGDYTQSAAAQCTVQIGGNTVQADIGQIAAWGAISLDGMLHVNLVNGFIPAPWESFIIFTSDADESGGEPLTGEFVNAHDTYTGACGTFDIVYDGKRVILSNYRPTPACLTPLKADLNGDCRVDLLDFAILASEWLTDGLTDEPM